MNANISSLDLLNIRNAFQYPLMHLFSQAKVADVYKSLQSDGAVKCYL